MVVRAKASLESEYGYKVLAGWISPSHDDYVGPKSRRNGNAFVPAVGRCESSRPKLPDVSPLSLSLVHLPVCPPVCLPICLLACLLLLAQFLLFSRFHTLVRKDDFPRKPQSHLAAQLVCMCPTSAQMVDLSIADTKAAKYWIRCGRWESSPERKGWPDYPVVVKVCFHEGRG